MEKATSRERRDRRPGWRVALGWGPRKFRELKTFFAEVRERAKKVTWPSQAGGLRTTTWWSSLTTVFFGFYLYGLDLLSDAALHDGSSGR